MMTDKEFSPTRRFVPAVLPWVVAAGMLVVYLLTFNHWVSFSSLGQVAKASGWSWQPELYGPLDWLVTLACRSLPAKLVPLALNLFCAVCAMLTLAVLARSVALLPHDRTHGQRERERNPFSLLSVRHAWLPPVLAVLVCGLQLTFWENATAPSMASPPWTGGYEMLNLLVFAYILRCLLEFRIDERQSWLTRASFLFGLSMTNNWAMVGFFPVFLAALVWSMGFGFFNLRFLSRMTLWGVAGLLFYLLLPVVQSLADIAQVPFWSALKANLAAQKHALASLPFSKQALLGGLTGDQPLWVLALPSLLPLLVLSIRWPSYFGDPSKQGVALTTTIFHFFHAVLLLFCIWVALDPQLSPRRQLPGMPLLTFYYLGALGIGYFAGYFLTVFGPILRPRQRPRPSSGYMRFFHAVATGGVFLLLVLAPALLLYRNLPQIRFTNGPMLRHYAAQQVQGLPRQRAVLLSDDPRRLVLVRAALAQDGRDADCLFLDTASLKWPDYHWFLKQRHPKSWTDQPPKDRKEPVSDVALVELVARLAATNAVYYLHPSFGYYFEVVYSEPHGLLYKLKHHQTNSLFAPPLTKELLAENEAFWTRLDKPVLQPLTDAIASPGPASNPGLMGTLVRWLHLPPEANPNAAVLATFYSRSLNYWGTELQAAGQLAQAAARFERAVDLNPDNRAAAVNLECNRNLQAGRALAPRNAQWIETQFGKYRSLEQAMGENGPFDEPNLCYQQALVYARNGLYRQAGHLFARVKMLAPEHLGARLWLAQLYLLGHAPDAALKTLKEIYAEPARFDLGRGIQSQLLYLEASAHLEQGDLQQAEAAVRSALKKFPNDEGLLVTATQVYMNRGYYSNALAAIEQQLQIAPDNTGALVNKGYACLQLNAYEHAIPASTRAMELETNVYSEVYNSALLNRAVAYLNANKIDAAQHDYESLQKKFPTEPKVYWGLGEVFYRKKDTNAALRSYQLFLTNAPPNAPEVKTVAARLKALKPDKPK